MYAYVGIIHSRHETKSADSFWAPTYCCQPKEAGSIKSSFQAHIAKLAITKFGVFWLEKCGKTEEWLSQRGAWNYISGDIIQFDGSSYTYAR